MQKEDKREEILNQYRQVKATTNSNTKHAMLNEEPMGVETLMAVGSWAKYRSRSSLLFRRRYEKNAASGRER